MSFTFANTNQPVPGNGGALPAEFSVTTHTDTDVWLKPPSTDSFNAPILYRTVSLESFERASVSVDANWTYLYDQGGLILVLNYNDGSRKWVKTGIEFTHERPNLSTVATDNWSDWSLQPMQSGTSHATLEAVREPDGSLWIYSVDGKEKSPMREVTWFFEEKNVKDVWVGVYAAKPHKEGGDLTVNFKNLNIELNANKLL